MAKYRIAPDNFNDTEASHWLKLQQKAEKEGRKFTDSELLLVEQICTMYYAIQEAKKEIAEKGITITQLKSGVIKANPACGVLTTASSVYKSYLEQLMFTTNSAYKQTKKVGEGKVEEKSPLEKMMDGD